MLKLYILAGLFGIVYAGTLLDHPHPHPQPQPRLRQHHSSPQLHRPLQHQTQQWTTNAYQTPTHHYQAPAYSQQVLSRPDQRPPLPHRPLSQPHQQMSESYRAPLQPHQQLSESYQQLLQPHQQLSESYQAPSQSHQQLSESYQAPSQSHQISTSYLHHPSSQRGSHLPHPYPEYTPGKPSHLRTVASADDGPKPKPKPKPKSAKPQLPKIKTEYRIRSEALEAVKGVAEAQDAEKEDNDFDNEDDPKFQLYWGTIISKIQAKIKEQQAEKAERELERVGMEKNIQEQLLREEQKTQWDDYWLYCYGLYNEYHLLDDTSEPLAEETQLDQPWDVDTFCVPQGAISDEKPKEIVEQSGPLRKRRLAFKGSNITVRGTRSADSSPIDQTGGLQRRSAFRQPGTSTPRYDTFPR